MCDYAIAADDITVLDPHMLPGTNNVPRWNPQLFLLTMPARQAAWYLMTGDKMSAQDLLCLNMVTEIVPREKLMDRAYEIADMFMKQNRVARRLGTQLIRRN